MTCGGIMVYIQPTIPVTTKRDVLPSTKQDRLYYRVKLSTIIGYQLHC